MAAVSTAAASSRARSEKTAMLTPRSRPTTSHMGTAHRTPLSPRWPAQRVRPAVSHRWYSEILDEGGLSVPRLAVPGGVGAARYLASSSHTETAHGRRAPAVGDRGRCRTLVLCCRCGRGSGDPVAADGLTCRQPGSLAAAGEPVSRSDRGSSPPPLFHGRLRVTVRPATPPPIG